jgi:beta-galactosidase
VALSVGSGLRWSELGRTTTADALFPYEEGPTAGSPAVTRNAAGEGHAYYVGTALDRAAMAELLPRVLADAALEVPAHASEFPDLEVVTRSSDDGSWLFAINHGQADASLSVDGTNLLSSTATDGEVAVPAGGVAVVRCR